MLQLALALAQKRQQATAQKGKEKNEKRAMNWDHRGHGRSASPWWPKFQRNGARGAIQILMLSRKGDQQKNSSNVREGAGS